MYLDSYRVSLLSLVVCLTVIHYVDLQTGRIRRQREIVRVKVLRRAVLNDTNGVRAGARREWEGRLSLSLFFSISLSLFLSLSRALALSLDVSSFMDFFYRCAGGP